MKTNVEEALEHFLAKRPYTSTDMYVAPWMHTFPWALQDELRGYLAWHKSGELLVAFNHPHNDVTNHILTLAKIPLRSIKYEKGFSNDLIVETPWGTRKVVSCWLSVNELLSPEYATH